MKSVWLAVALLPLTGVAGTASRSEFEWRFPIEASCTSGHVYRMEIPPELYGRSHNFPRDIRIIDDDQRSWPFFAESVPSKSITRPIPFDRLNQAHVEGTDHYQRIDLVMKRNTGETQRPRHNQLFVGTTGSEFIRRVELLGSDDQETWALLGRGYLLDVSQPRPIREYMLHYPVSDYPFLQVRVYPNAHDALESFAITDVSVQHLEPNEPPTRVLTHRSVDVPPAEKRDDMQTLVLDLGHVRVPFSMIRLAASGDYVRRVVVSARDSEQDPWRYVTAGDIHRIGPVVKDAVPASARARWIKVDIYHYDDPPLDLKTIVVEDVRPFFVFEAHANGTAALYAGAPHAEGPRFDLQQRVATSDGRSWPLVTLGEGVANPHFRTDGYGSWGRWLAVVAVGVASLAVLWIIVRMFRRTMAGTGEAHG